MKAPTIFAFLGGAALGAMVALMLAPNSGRKTRKKLKKKLKKMSPDELNDLITRFKLSRAKESIKDIIG